MISNSRGQLVNAWTLFRQLKVHETRFLSGKRQIWGLQLYVAGTPLPEQDFLIVISAQASQNGLTDYAKRGEIETLFACLKTRGFRFEDTHLTKPERLCRLLSLLAFTFTWAYLTGEWLCQNGQTISLKKTLNRPLKSIFRHGLDFIRHLLFNFHDNFQLFKRTVQLLSCT